MNAILSWTKRSTYLLKKGLGTNCRMNRPSSKIILGISILSNRWLTSARWFWASTLMNSLYRRLPSHRNQTSLCLMKRQQLQLLWPFPPLYESPLTPSLLMMLLSSILRTLPMPSLSKLLLSVVLKAKISSSLSILFSSEPNPQSEAFALLLFLSF